MNSIYKNWILDIKQKIKSAQLKAALAVNAEMILLYWDIGKEIVEKQNNFSWGSKVIEMMAKDLKRELPDSSGFSRSNLFSMRKFYLLYKDSEFVPQAGGQIASGDDKRKKETVQKAAGQLKKQRSKAKNELVQQAAGLIEPLKDDKNIVRQVAGQLNKSSLLAKIPWWHLLNLIQMFIMKTNLKLTAVFEEAEEGGYIAFFKELPGINSEGETLEEAKTNLLDALDLVMDAQRMLSESV